MQHIGEIVKSKEFVGYMSQIKESPIEAKLVAMMFSFGLEPETQVEIGKYRADVVLENKAGERFVVECDGDQWHQDKDRERTRDRYLSSKGYTVIHFSGKAIYRNPRKCVYDLIFNYFPEHTQGEKFIEYAEHENELAYKEGQLALLQKEKNNPET